ncbi:uncharacterized protein LOC118205493 [Stegodyphus dumicola]|uniref:uncharacterized protein LOC118205493 n=1 Tax=Stegodyphus dumicola TaxID=202533 RepID=UPI0015A98AB6|nr:uncharacterized protein LOC118205493 [Stegodyphus dumicola]
MNLAPDSFDSERSASSGMDERHISSVQQAEGNTLMSGAFDRVDITNSNSQHFPKDERNRGNAEGKNEIPIPNASINSSVANREMLNGDLKNVKNLKFPHKDSLMFINKFSAKQKATVSNNKRRRAPSTSNRPTNKDPASKRQRRSQTGNNARRNASKIQRSKNQNQGKSQAKRRGRSSKSAQRASQRPRSQQAKKGKKVAAKTDSKMKNESKGKN